MKRRIAGMIMLCCTILLLSGCGASSTIEGKPFDAEGAEYYSNLLDADFYGYAFQFQKDVQGQLMTQEIWQNGICTDRHVLWYGGTDPKTEKKYYLAAVRMRDEQGNHIGQELQGIISDESSEYVVHSKLASLQNLFPIPAGSYGYYFLEGTQKVEAGGHYILALWDMEQAQKGIGPLDLKSLQNMDYQEELKDRDYVILLRMDTYATEAEAAAAAEALE